jgi:hypothetical protein
MIICDLSIGVGVYRATGERSSRVSAHRCSVGMGCHYPIGDAAYTHDITRQLQTHHKLRVVM